jgi:sugar phosphate isomerase/epimerase
MIPLRIEQMTMFDVEPEDVVTIASKVGVDMVGLWTTDAFPGGRPVTSANKRSVLERLRDSSVIVDTVEAFYLCPDPREYEGQIVLAAELGAKAIVVMHVGTSSEDEAASQLAELCALAANYGLLVSLEPISMGATRTPAQGLRLVRKSGASNARLTIDVLHIIRTATPMSDVAALDPALVGSVQICDGPKVIPDDQLIEEAGFSRMVPGQGEFPLLEFLRAIPHTVNLGLEVPLRGLREGGVPALDRTRRVVEATRALLANL